MRPGAVILGICVSVVLLVAVGGLYFMADNNGSRQYRKSIDLVRQMQLLSSDWSMEIARVKSDPFADFDSLAAFIPRMAQFKNALSDTALRAPDLPDRLASDIQAYLNAIEAKEERIERFKTGYAVVRNSNRYLPLAAANVLGQAQEAGDDALARSISDLMRDVNLYVATPSESAQSRLTEEIRKQREASVSYPPALANALANLLSHAEVLVVKQGPTEELFQSATSNDISDLTAELSGKLECELGKKQVLTTYYDIGILGAFAVVIAFWILLALQQRGRAAGAGAAALPAHARESAVEKDDVVDTIHPVDKVDEPGPPRVDPVLAARPAAPTALAPLAGGHVGAESTLLHGFVVKSLAGVLADSADEIAGRMDYLRQTQQRIQGALLTSDAIAQLSDGADVDEEVETISAIALGVRQRANGIADLAKRLDSFASAPTNHVDRSMIDLNACVEDVIAATWAESDAMIVRSLGDIPEIFASKAEFEILLAEIVGNSIHAVRGLDERQGIIKIDTIRKNDEILITVIDNGTGIPPERRMSIFKPFYTSRDGAMGIGLALAGHLAKKYEGVIKIHSLPGQGTVARIALPTGISSV